MIQYLPLPMISGSRFQIKPDNYEEIAKEVQDFIDTTKQLNSKEFATDVMFSHEIKANNSIEGYYDDVEFVKEIINQKLMNFEPEQRQRILNLYEGYNYILQGKNINSDSLRKLYALLSNGLLDEQDLAAMGPYYRTKPVYIYCNTNLLVEPERGMPEDSIDKFMDAYFEFLNSNSFGENLTTEYIKSQILHFYFVYIHPYFDVNGRTSRTTAMWYLLNKKAYPFIIFNRGINFKKNEYYHAIQDVRKFRDITFFIKYMLETVKVELEKEYIMQSISQNCDEKLTSEDWQSILYLLSMKSGITTLDFATIYNQFNPKKSVQSVFATILTPLMDKGIIISTGETKHHLIGQDMPNLHLDFNPQVMDYDRDKIKQLIKYR